MELKSIENKSRNIFKKFKIFLLPVIIIGGGLILFLGFFFRFPNQSKLTNFTAASHPDDITFESIYDGSYQTAIEKWITDNFWGHNYATKWYNQIQYSVLHEGVGDWIIGDDGYVFAKNNSKSIALNEDITNLSAYDDYARSIKEFQDSLESNGKKFVCLLTPRKAEIYADKLPATYKFLASKYAAGSNKATDVLEAAFDKYGVHYYDTLNILTEMRDSDQNPVFYSTGHHWSLDAAALATNDMFKYMETIYDDLDLPRIIVEGETDDVYGTDKDAYNALSLFSGIEGDYHTPIITYDQRSPLNLLIYGTSFGVELEDVLYRSQGNRGFDQFIYNHYFTIKFSYDDDGKDRQNYNENTPLSEIGVMEDLRNSDIVILEQQRSAGVPSTHKKYIDYVNDHYEKIYYEIGEDIALNTVDDADADFENFYSLEEWGRWGTGNDSSVTLYLADEEDLFNNQYVLHLTAKSYDQVRDCDVYINGYKLGILKLYNDKFDEYYLKIPSNILHPGENTIEFKINGIIRSPKDLGRSSDSRSMGIGIKYLALEVY